MPSGGDAENGASVPMMMAADATGVSLLYEDASSLSRLCRFDTSGTELWDLAAAGFELPHRPGAGAVTMAGRCMACDDDGNTIILNGSRDLYSYAPSDGSENWTITPSAESSFWSGVGSIIECYNGKIQVVGEYVQDPGDPMSSVYYYGSEFNLSGVHVRDIYADMDGVEIPSGDDPFSNGFIAFDTSGNIISAIHNTGTPSFIAVGKSKTDGSAVVVWSGSDDTLIDSINYGCMGIALDEDNDVILAYLAGVLLIDGTDGIATELTKVEVDNDNSSNPVDNRIKWLRGASDKTMPAVIGLVEFDEWGQDPAFSNSGNLAGITSGDALSFAASWGKDPNDTNATELIDSDYAGGCYVAGTVQTTANWP